MSESILPTEVFSKTSSELFSAPLSLKSPFSLTTDIADLSNPVFQYRIRGASTLIFTTDPAFGEDVTQERFDADIASITGFPAVDVNTIGRAIFQRLYEYARNTQRMPVLYHLFQMRPTSGGSSTTIGGFHNAGQIKAGMLITALKATVSMFRQGLSILLDSVRGLKMPIIHSISALPSKTLNRYVATKMNEIKCLNGDFDESDELSGVFYAPVAGGPPVRAVIYGEISDTLVQSQAPPEAVGPQNVSLVTKPGLTYLTVTYGVSLTAGLTTMAAPVELPVVPAKPV